MRDQNVLPAGALERIERARVGTAERAERLRHAAGTFATGRF